MCRALLKAGSKAVLIQALCTFGRLKGSGFGGAEKEALFGRCKVAGLGPDLSALA